MAGRIRRGLRFGLRFFAWSVMVALVWSWAAYFWPVTPVEGSPPRMSPVQQNGVDLSERGNLLGRYAKVFRPAKTPGRLGWLGTLVGPALYAGPIVYYFGGWDIYADHVCMEGKVIRPHISDDDGDFNFALRLPPGSRRYGWRKVHPEDAGTDRLIYVEIDEFVRDYYPVVYDIAENDWVLVCGMWVYDRGHDHNEIHGRHGTYVKILKKVRH